MSETSADHATRKQETLSEASGAFCGTKRLFQGFSSCVISKSVSKNSSLQKTWFCEFFTNDKAAVQTLCGLWQEVDRAE